MTEFSERRRFKRYPIYCPLQYKAEDSLPRQLSITLNVSEGGALISINKKLEETAGLIVRVVMRNEEFFIRSRVVHVGRYSQNDPYAVGVEFLERSAGFAARFYEELETIMSYQINYGEEIGRHLSLAEASMKWYHNSPAWV